MRAPLLFLLVACSASIDDPTGTPRPEPTPRELACDEGPTTASTPLTRLNRTQWSEAVATLLDLDATEVAATLVDDARAGGFDVGRGVSAVHLERYLDAAASIAALADVARLVGDDTQIDFARRLARRAWRRTPTPEELDALATLHALGDTPDASARLVIEAIVASPDFLFHVEASPDTAPGDVARLDDHALASRLAFFLWRGLPDDALLADAEAGVLHDTLETHARRLIADPRFELAVRDFHRQWLGLEAIENLVKGETYADFDADVARDLRASLEAFVAHVYANDATLDALLTDDTVFVNARLGVLYGLPTDSSILVATHDPNRRGLLGQPGLLARLGKPDQSDPIHRGLFVRERLLCQTLPMPPNDVDLTIRPPEPGASTRDRFAEHTASEACAVCHRLIDPIGFGFESFDGIGRFRTTDEGVAVDTSGEVLGAEDASGTFDGQPELAEQLAQSATVRRCVATQWMRFALGREESAADACSIDDVDARFATAGGDLRELVIAIATSDAFRHRRVPTP